MKHWNTITLLVLSWIAFSCAEPVRVATDYARNTDFIKYQTFAFAPEVDSLPLNDIQRNRILGSVENALEAEGFTKVEGNPDVLIDILLKVREEEQAVANTYNMGGGYYYMRGGMTTTQIDINKYKVGTMAINMIDNEKKELVWQGIAEGTLSDQPRDKNEAVDRAVRKVFMYYPPK